MASILGQSNKKYDEEKARRDYLDLGPLTPELVAMLAKQKAPHRQRTLANWYGYQGSIYATAQYKLFLKKLGITEV